MAYNSGAYFSQFIDRDSQSVYKPLLAPLRFSMSWPDIFGVKGKCVHMVCGDGEKVHSIIQFSTVLSRDSAVATTSIGWK